VPLTTIFKNVIVRKLPLIAIGYIPTIAKIIKSFPKELKKRNLSKEA
jgi:hypothetical protein